MAIDLNKSQASSSLPGLTDLGTTTQSITVQAFSLASGAKFETGIGFVFPRNDVISVARIKLTGASSPISSYWFPVQGACTIQDTNAGKPNFAFWITNALGGRQLNILVHNNTGAGMTVGTFTVDAQVHMYLFPF